VITRGQHGEGRHRVDVRVPSGITVGMLVVSRVHD